MSSKQLLFLEEKIGYSFNNKQLFKQSLTHKSYSNESSDDKTQDNERLEFLGDAILQFIISDLLIKNYPFLNEGDLSKFRSVLVSEKGLHQIALQLTLGSYLSLGNGEELSGGREKPSILSDALEALIAAIYLDSKEQYGFEKINSIVYDFFYDQMIRSETTFVTIDYKSFLQEYVQQFKLGPLNYELLSETGPDHEKEFTSLVSINQQPYQKGVGRSKKNSEQEAAKNTLKYLQT